MSKRSLDAWSALFSSFIGFAILLEVECPIFPDIRRFREIACERARQINRLTKAEAREIAFHLREKRIASAIGLLSHGM
jgi:hypothetical protein